MFSCNTHGWSHIQSPCPICHPVHTYTLSGTTITIPRTVAPEPKERVSEEKVLLEAMEYIFLSLGATSRAEAFVAGYRAAEKKARGE